jgi:hypothetical protein
MPSLGIAPRPGGCVGLPSRPSQGTAPVSGVFPTDGALHHLGIRIQAIQLSPYHAGPSTHHLIRLSAAAGFLTCSCPLHLSDPGKSSDPGTFLRVPPNFIGDTTGRLAAHEIELPVDDRVTASTGIGEVDRDLGVLDPAGGSAVLARLWVPRTMSHALTWAFSRHPHSPATIGMGMIGHRDVPADLPHVDPCPGLARAPDPI